MWRTLIWARAPHLISDTPAVLDTHLHHPLAFDLTRMFVGAAGSTPRGIDRVDMGYATRIFGEPGGRNVGLVPALSRMGVLTAKEAGRLAGTVERYWRETRPPGDDRKLAWLKARLAGDLGPTNRLLTRDGSGAAPSSSAVLRYTRLLLNARMSPLRFASAAVPQGAVYVNTGQILLGWDWFFTWLDHRPDVKPVLMLHDLIPMLYPEYSGPILSRHHARGLRMAAKRATALIATSHAAADEIRDGLVALGRHDMPIHVVPLPVSESLLGGDATSEPVSSTPYFVTVGNIDQRKNHILLLQVWRDMLQRGAPLPKLVIVGSRGLRTQGVIDLLERCPGLGAHVIEVNGLTSQAMREVVRGARALLMPSFTEGFGLPIVEALALGTPVIASDIAAHREVGGATSVYLEPLDGPGWRDEILRRAAESAADLMARRARLSGPATQTWTSYFDDVLPFLHDL